MQNPKRNVELDAVRGIAVLMVVLHHFLQIFSLPANLNWFSQFFINFGQYGVELFFIVSGFVIFSSYPEIRSIKNFILQRVTRLIPALGLAISINFIIAVVQGKINSKLLLSSISSFLIIDPNLLNRIFGTSYFSWIDNSYWTLFIEMTFYINYGLIFFMMRNKSLKFKILCFASITIFLKATAIFFQVTDLTTQSTILHYLFFSEWSGFFLSGILLACFFKIKESWICKAQKISIVAVVLFFWAFSSPLNKLQTRVTSPIAIVGILVIGLLIILSSNNYKIFVAKFIGEPSYVTYILHQNFFTHLYKFNEVSGLSIFYEILVFISLFYFSFLIHEKFEISTIRKLRKKLI